MELNEIKNSIGNLISKGNKQKQLLGSDEIELTPKGKYVAENEAWSGNPARVLMVLDRGSATIKEISDDARLPIVTVKDIVETLIKKKMAQKLNFNGE